MRANRAMLVFTMSALVLGMAGMIPSAAADKKAAPAAGKDAAAAPAEPKTHKIKGTIKVEGNPPLEELKKKIKITQADAEKAAIKEVGAKDGTKVSDSELEIEQGFLIYSIDVKVAGKSGVEEVWVDAGSGKVLLRTHEADDDDDDEESGEDAKDDSE